jgi:hypothetical protein
MNFLTISFLQFQTTSVIYGRTDTPLATTMSPLVTGDDTSAALTVAKATVEQKVRYEVT